MSSLAKDTWQFPLGDLGAIKIHKPKGQGKKWVGTIFLKEDEVKAFTSFTYYGDDPSKTRDSFDDALRKKLGKVKESLYEELAKLGATVLAEHFTELQRELPETNGNSSINDEEWEQNAEKYKDLRAARSGIAAILSIEDKNFSTRDRYSEATKIAYKHFFAQGNFYFYDLAQEAYWFDGVTKRLLKLESDRYRSFLADRLGLNREDILFKWVSSGIKDRVAEHALKIEPHRLSFYDEKSQILYYNNQPGRMLKLDGEAITEIDNGVDNVLFLWDEDWQEFTYLPAPEKNLWRELIYTKLSLDEREMDLTPDEASALLDSFVLTLVFRDIVQHRPLLALVGPWGSGKTVEEKMIGLAIFGPRFEVLGLEDQKQDAAIAYATNSAYGVFDNADERIKWLPDLLARIATRSRVPRRKLYTTNDLVMYRVDLLLGITARTTPWARPDVVSRLLLFKVKPPLRFIDEKFLYDSVLKKRGELLSELLERANRAVHKMKTSNADSVSHESPTRLAGFYSFSLMVSENRMDLESGFDKILRLQEQMSAEEEEALITLLIKWVDLNGAQTKIDDTNVRWTPEKTTTELFNQLSQLAENDHIDMGIKNAKSLGIQLKNNAPALESSGVRVNWKHTRGGNTWKFSRTIYQNDSSQISHTSPSTNSSTGQGEESVMSSAMGSEDFTQNRAQSDELKSVKSSEDNFVVQGKNVAFAEQKGQVMVSVGLKTPVETSNVSKSWRPDLEGAVIQKDGQKFRRCKKHPEAVLDEEHIKQEHSENQKSRTGQKSTSLCSGCKEGTSASPIPPISPHEEAQRISSNKQGGIEETKMKFKQEISVFEEKTKDLPILPRKELANDQKQFIKFNVNGCSYEVINVDFSHCSLDENSVDAIITDPPYGSEYVPLWNLLAEQAARILKPRGFLVAYAGDTYFDKYIQSLSRHLKYVSELTIELPEGRFSRLPGFLANERKVLVYCKGSLDQKFAEGKILTSIRGAGPDKRFHEWGQPVSEFIGLLETFTKPGGLVLEPFAGGGTTIQACIETKRSCIAYEIVQDSFLTMKERFSQYLLQERVFLDLSNEEEKKSVV